MDEPKGAKNTHPIDLAGFFNREFMCYFMHDGCAQMAEIEGSKSRQVKCNLVGRLPTRRDYEF